MKHTEAEILDALTVIKEVCDDVVGCDECPFYFDAIKCVFGMDMMPAEWQLNEDAPKVWRAFR